MLKKYPLPSNWTEVPDGNLDRCYYWNLETDEVSWLPPSHPRSHITQSAMKLRRKERRVEMKYTVLFQIKRWRGKRRKLDDKQQDHRKRKRRRRRRMPMM